ncbi:2-keto-4-pentenoate hydratase/2-oxohepta-3-ene-1,7-dioic acid hydratase in catechol pathway [Amycolatopsis bartoniae]|uniref:Hydroxylase n=1 Tax=Amycolatopsis bartoniae TaxID=941986 RepID=A0A8H9IPU9_9PSEU|nr:fumarylacetoacetate hydrolase family protein [Amycolatopsis bartoniae]MBB2940217.1 2-keto-4-pentenoate hydratase/2-oxohepta-3-ene-1,7-dioic acid hydratase in catechol pathway [Amycolatopsis bartoniae]TVT10176.1 fumarylacetoacetate hydrolase family protein [Amycolatopsis bartoniae]GHF35135.1 hydroxylase [Amycolatopsis bartoniae]
MRWSSYRTASSVPRLAVATDDGRLHASRTHTGLVDLLREGGDLASAAEEVLADPLEVIALDDVVLTAPIPEPPSIRDFMAFEDHLKPILAARGASIDPAWYEIPVFYFTNPAATQGPRDEVRAAPGAVELDYELEVAAVVGRPLGDADPATAQDAIAGYVLMNDWSARDLQRRERGAGLGPVKGKDWATSFGPFFVTADEFPLDGETGRPAVTLRASVNGRPYSEGNLRDLYWTFGEMIAYASRGTRLRPGDIIGSGTVGTGCIADLSARHGLDRYPWLRPGDRVRLEAGRLGAIDTVLAPAAEIVPLRG